MNRTRTWMLILLAPLPFLTLYIHHFLNASATVVPTGFLQTDMPYYSANGREIFEGGNGILYPNPYNENGEVIYFHWFPWILGGGIKILGFDPGYQFVFYGVMTAFLLSWVTYQLIEKTLPNPAFRGTIFLMAMWGGGFLILAKVGINLISGLPILENLFLLDRDDGYWFLNWGRNLMYTTETLYHVLFAATWLSLINKRWGLALLFCGLLATTHPFSGVQLLLILIVYLYAMSIFNQEKIPAWPRVTSLFLFAGFAAYYFWYLNQFASHQAIQGAWAIPWSYTFEVWLLNDGWLMAIALIGLIKAYKNISSMQWLWIISALISLALAKHDLLMTAHQPLHFTRGYTWLPLLFLAAPLIQRFFIFITQKFSVLPARVIINLLLMMVIVDNFAFVAKTLGPEDFSLYLTQNESNLYQWINQNQLTGRVLIPDDPFYSYLTATYTGLTPYLGHWSISPNYRERDSNVKDFRAGKPLGDWFNTMDYVIVSEENLINYSTLSNWKILRQEGDLILLARP